VDDAGPDPAPVHGVHVHGVHRTAMREREFVSVIAQECLTADALTKVVMACGDESRHVLREFGAAAYVFSRCPQRPALILP